MVKEDSLNPVFLEGKLECEKEVRINEIGSEGGAITKIEVGRKEGSCLIGCTIIPISRSVKQEEDEENLTKGICYRNRRGHHHPFHIVYGGRKDLRWSILWEDGKRLWGGDGMNNSIQMVVFVQKR